ncbi:hypothetical protein SPRG_11620 [Saprolegnia parasitica CBS 223.65]|uniref:START domain-containing protein n=1 Tax=Saprolegnia parasitica (strain CBS 223.65) TaxID=695850 RepID=A0A067C9U5_SAPPC|nr:hypothetical protein SPRG_11620 [Saprolegnia parasitica CBS 223.65]KDO23306.1 hypothetical protein SPRG_11620 [Saprolegnia parasitica CBS 223.65]|eukprot:XP_012205958.1 hypothetical protein SPRG_11620 [Saprolegnia parasitica CBS 223.65]
MDALLSTPETDDDVSTQLAAPKRSPYQRYMDRQHAEAASLQRQVTELRGQLRALATARELADAAHPATSEWARLAKAERKRLCESRTDNRRLKVAVKEYTEHAQALALLIGKTPRPLVVAMDPNDQWKHLRLGADPLLRYSGYHAMADRERHHLRSAFLEAGLVESRAVPHSFETRVFHQTLEIQARVCVRLPRRFDTPMDFEIMTRVIWDIMSGNVIVASPTGYREVLTKVDDTITYITTKRHYTLGSSVRNVIVKRYMEANRFVLVWRSVEDDELFPFEDGRDVAREVGWMLLEPCESGFLFKVFTKLQPFTSGHDCSPDEIRTYMQDLHGASRNELRMFLLEADKQFTAHQRAAFAEKKSAASAAYG